MSSQVGQFRVRLASVESETMRDNKIKLHNIKIESSFIYTVHKKKGIFVFPWPPLKCIYIIYQLVCVSCVYILLLRNLKFTLEWTRT